MITDQKNQLPDNNLMLKTEIQSGPANVLTAGVVRSYKANDIKIKIRGVLIVFRQIRDDKPGKELFVEVDKANDAYLFCIRNFKTWMESSGEYKVGEMIVEQNDETRKGVMEVYFKYTPIHDGSFSIEYTFYFVDSNHSNA